MTIAQTKTIANTTDIDMYLKSELSSVSVSRKGRVPMLTKGHYTYLSKTVFVTTQIKPDYLHKTEYISQYRVVIFKIKKNYSNTKSYPFF